MAVQVQVQVLLLCVLLRVVGGLVVAEAEAEGERSSPWPEPWPEQFHAVLFMNYSNELSLVDLWYDWPGGRNFNIIRDQLASAPPLFDLEWNNGTSFFYTLQDPRTCRSVQLEVGVLRPDWLDGATYLGRAHVDGFLCDTWTKADFIWYYQDVDTKRPLKWVFYTGRTAHVMVFEEGAALEDAAWQAPPYCFPLPLPQPQLTIANPNPFPLSSTLF